MDKKSIYFRIKNYTLIESSDYPQIPIPIFLFISRAVNVQGWSRDREVIICKAI